MPIAIPDFVAASPGDVAAGLNIADVVRADLERSGLFKPLDPKSFIDKVTNINAVPNFANWRIITAQGLVTGSAAIQPDGRMRVDFRLWDVYGESQMLGLQYFTHARQLAAHCPYDFGCDLSAHHRRKGLFRYAHCVHFGKRARR